MWILFLWVLLCFSVYIPKSTSIQFGYPVYVNGTIYHVYRDAVLRLNARLRLTLFWYINVFTFFILGDPEADSGGLNGRKNMAQRKVKNGEKSPRGQCLTRPVPNGRCRSGFWLVPESFCVFLPNQKAERRRPFGTGLVRHCLQGLFSKFLTFLRAIFFRPFRLSLAPTIYLWVSEDDFSCETLAGQILVRLKRFKIKNRKCYASKQGQRDPRLHSTTLNWTSELDCLNYCV